MKTIRCLAQHSKVVGHASIIAPRHRANRIPAAGEGRQPGSQYQQD
jgi:hypothetical protein